MPTQLIPILLWASIALYLSAAGLGFNKLRPKQSAIDANREQFGAVVLLGVAAWLTHSIYAAHVAFEVTANTHEITLVTSSHTMIILIAAILNAIFLIACSVVEIRRLAVLVFTLTAISLVFASLWVDANSSSIIVSRHSPTSLKLHLVTSILAYAFITLATAQGVLFKYQEARIKHRVQPSLLALLPPLETMERLLFSLLTIGVTLLTLTLLSGIFFSQALFAKPFTFNHHTLLALMGWGVLVWALVANRLGRLTGSEATKWLIGGFILIQLGYFGTKIISDLLN